MDQEQRAEALNDYKLMSADELKAQLGDDAEQDALINEVLAGGKQVEAKGQSANDEKSGQASTHHSVGEGDDDEAEGDEEEEADPEADAEAEAAPEVEPAADVAAAADAVAEVAPEAAPAPTLEEATAALPAPDLSGVNKLYADKQDALDATKAEALAKLMGGEIDAAEYSKLESQYMRDRDALRDEKAGTVAWVADAHKFQIKVFQETGINYTTDVEKSDALHEWVTRLDAKYPNKSATEVMEMAHKKVLLEFDIAPAAKAAAAPVPAAKPAAPVKKGRAPDLSGIPPTLGNLPAASNPGSGDGGEFAHINDLSGMDYERALSRLTPDQQARYLAE